MFQPWYAQPSKGPHNTHIYIPTTHKNTTHTHTTCNTPTTHTHSDPLSKGMSAAMAMREREEEQTQLTMVALNETVPFYPGKTQEEVQTALQEVGGVFESSLL